jgi:fermentation-respiration switch protein FrsA (DUF1100 family)
LDKLLVAVKGARPSLEAGAGESELLAQIHDLTAKLEEYNAEQAATAPPPKATALITYKAGGEFTEKAGGCFKIVFKAKPRATDAELAKLNGRIKGVFMAVPKNVKHKMTPNIYMHADGIRRWEIEVAFPYSTLDKVNTLYGEHSGKGENAYVTQGVQMVKDYLEQKKIADAVPFATTVQVNYDCSVISLIEFLDPNGEYRSQMAAMAGPEATLPPQVARFHTEMLEHLDMVDSITVKTKERDLTVDLGNLRLDDFFSQPSEEVPKVVVDLQPVQEVLGGLGMGIVGGGVALADKILYRNDIKADKTVENTTPAEFGLAYEDVNLETQDGSSLACWLIKSSTAKSPTLLYFHGNAGDMASRLEHVKALNEALQCNVFMVSYRGYGKSTGKPSEEGFMEDAAEALKWLDSNAEIDSGKIVVFGHSVGGAVAIHLVASSQEVKPKALIVENTFTSIAEMVGPLLRRVGDWLPSQWKNHEKIQEVACPVLLLSGRNDTIVPPEMMDLLKCAATSSSNATLAEFPKGHNDTMDGDGYYDQIKSFVSSSI